MQSKSRSSRNNMVTGVSGVVVILTILLSFTTLCCGISCVHCVATDNEDPCVGGPFDEFFRSCCPMMSNAACHTQGSVKDGKIQMVQRGCKPTGGKQEPGCKDSGGGNYVCLCFEDNCNTVNLLKPDEISGHGSGATLAIKYWTVTLLATFVLALYNYA